MKNLSHLYLVLGLIFSISTAMADPYSDPSDGLPTTSSDYKILEDMKMRVITPDEAWLYRVQARFNIKNLPEKYLPETSSESPEFNQNSLGPQFLNEVTQALPKMSAETQKKIIPYLLPPSAVINPTPGPKFKSLTMNCPGTAPIPEPFPEGQWIYDDRDPTFRFWYVNYPKFGQAENEWVIAHLLPALNKAKSKYEALFNKTLLSDVGGGTFKDAAGTTHIWCDGGNGKYDIYLNKLFERRYGMVLAYPGKTSVAPSFMIVDPTQLYQYNERTEFTAAHELMHSFQFVHERNLNFKAYNDSDEGIANWGANYVLPDNNYEHAYFFMAEYPDTSLLNRDYDTWYFYLYATQMYGESFIANLLREEVSLNPFQAIDKLVPGGLKKFYPEFSIKGWNQEDVIGTAFKTWDNYNFVIRGFRNVDRYDEKQHDIKLDERGEFMIEKEYSIPMGLSRIYDKFNIDSKVKSLSLNWGKAAIAEENFHFRLLKKKNGSWTTENWDPKERPQKYKFKETICFDDPKEERFDEMVIVITRSDIAPKYGIWDKSKIKFRIGANNVPCYAVEGKGKYSRNINSGTRGSGNYREEKYETEFTARFESKRDPDGRLTDTWEPKTASAKFSYSTILERYDPCAPALSKSISRNLFCMFNSADASVETCTGSKSGTINIDIPRSEFSISSVYTGASTNNRYYKFNLRAGLPGVDMVNVDCPKSADYLNNVTHQDIQSPALLTVKPDGKIQDGWKVPNKDEFVWEFAPVK